MAMRRLSSGRDEGKPVRLASRLEARSVAEGEDIPVRVPGAGEGDPARDCPRHSGAIHWLAERHGDDLVKRDVDVVLGGGVFRSDDERFLARIRDGIVAIAPSTNLKRLDAPPVLGAALIGLDRLGAKRPAEAALRSTLTHERLTAGRR